MTTPGGRHLGSRCGVFLTMCPGCGKNYAVPPGGAEEGVKCPFCSLVQDFLWKSFVKAREETEVDIIMAKRSYRCGCGCGNTIKRGETHVVLRGAKRTLRIRKQCAESRDERVIAALVGAATNL